MVVRSHALCQDALRTEVELELATARQKIQSIQRSMEAGECSRDRSSLCVPTYPDAAVTGRGVRKRSNETAGGGKRKFTGQPLIPPTHWKEDGAERGWSLST